VVGLPPWRTRRRRPASRSRRSVMETARASTGRRSRSRWRRLVSAATCVAPKLAPSAIRSTALATSLLAWIRLPMSSPQCRLVPAQGAERHRNATGDRREVAATRGSAGSGCDRFSEPSTLPRSSDAMSRDIFKRELTLRQCTLGLVLCSPKASRVASTREHGKRFCSKAKGFRRNVSIHCRKEIQCSGQIDDVSRKRSEYSCKMNRQSRNVISPRCVV
jgi:hypothetical protein